MKLEILRSRLELYLDCERKLLSGAIEYRIGDRMLRRADLSTVRKIIDDLAEEIDLIEGVNRGKRIKRVVVVDN